MVLYQLCNSHFKPPPTLGGLDSLLGLLLRTGVTGAFNDESCSRNINKDIFIAMFTGKSERNFSLQKYTRENIISIKQFDIN